MLVVAGLSLKNLHPRVWDLDSPFYLPELTAVMVSYADLHTMRARRQKAMKHGLHALLGVPDDVKIYLDNGAFYFLRRDGELPRDEYDAFVAAAKPDWWPIPRDYIPDPSMPAEDQREFLNKTMEMNRTYQHDGYVPIIHVGRMLEEYIAEFRMSDKPAGKMRLGLGGIVPNLLRAPKALPYQDVLQALVRVRDEFRDAELHLFGVGGTATLHLAALLEIDSIDSSGWRNRAARGIVQLPGRGDRLVADLGKWRGRIPSDEEREMLSSCGCPSCKVDGLEGLEGTGLAGFCHRATHNLWTLLEEARSIEEQLQNGTYEGWYAKHVSNSTYRPLIDELVTCLAQKRDLLQG